MSEIFLGEMPGGKLRKIQKGMVLAILKEIQRNPETNFEKIPESIL